MIETTHIGQNCSGAVFSTNRRFRYALWRVWDRERPAIIFIGLNPSYANEYKDDPTVVRMSRRARYDNYGGIYIGNLFALISTQPLLFNDNAVGPANDDYLMKLKRVAGIVVVGWGNHGRSIERDKIVLDILGKPVYCFSVTKMGMPTHPLYLSYAADLQEYLPDGPKQT
jgi:hypothetical protein